MAPKDDTGSSGSGFDFDWLVDDCDPVAVAPPMLLMLLTLITQTPPGFQTYVWPAMGVPCEGTKFIKGLSRNRGGSRVTQANPSRQKLPSAADKPHSLVISSHGFRGVRHCRPARVQT